MNSKGKAKALSKAHDQIDQHSAETAAIAGSLLCVVGIAAVMISRRRKPAAVIETAALLDDMYGVDVAAEAPALQA